MIYSSLPADWKELQSFVCEIFNECGYMTESPKTISPVRSEALEVDVYVKDNSVPRQTIICEYKYWDNKIPQSVVHAFRAQVSDIGANRLDSFIEFNGRDLLMDAGKISAEQAKLHAETQF